MRSRQFAAIERVRLGVQQRRCRRVTVLQHSPSEEVWTVGDKLRCASPTRAPRHRLTVHRIGIGTMQTIRDEGQSIQHVASPLMSPRKEQRNFAQRCPEQRLGFSEPPFIQQRRAQQLSPVPCPTRAKTTNASIESGSGVVSEFAVTGLDRCTVARVDDQEEFRAPTGQMKSHVVCASDRVVMGKPLTVSWTMRYR